jgi:hypothetical protein
MIQAILAAQMWTQNSEKFEKIYSNTQIFLETTLCISSVTRLPMAEITIAVFLKSW